MAASAPIHLLLSPSRSTWPPQDPSLRPILPLHAWPARQRHLRAARCALSPPTPSLDLPLLPFQPAEVLIPSESKTLHLYEARYIALLEEALYKREKSFVHFVLDPVVDSSTKASFAIVAVGIDSGANRVQLADKLKIFKTDHFDSDAYVQSKCCAMDEKEVRHLCSYLQDLKKTSAEEMRRSVHANYVVFIKASKEISDLEGELLSVPEDEPLQTNIRASLLWSEKESFEEYNESFIPGRPERLSFAAYQTVSGMSDEELLTVQNYKIQAMDSTDTLERLNTGINFVEHNIGMIAARLAIQNI
ncbi:Exocyst complex component EXO84B [Zea mays]|uniref:Exocyst complex component EXO84B n=1 Tax=Zea mays TaxID=4577 RepID=A0A3L6F1B0_MAIZE|nr:Exocyst complex component EXO84B [Zea mays]